MRIIAVADTHLQEWQIPEKLIELMRSADLIVHAGDFVSFEVYEKFSEFDLVAVKGDNDDPKLEKLPEIAKFKVDNLEIGLVHKGNYLNIFDDLIYKAMELNVDLLIFGHIHRFVFEKIKNRAILCPGSPTEPRMSFASCAEILIDRKDVEVKCHLVQSIFCSFGGENLEGIGWRKERL
ncbi:MAG: YfcE family phosphodiesterase [Archaeoglobaceae archaeon]|nr:YfcE family phosphodiesterase [Archaeoglobaceae archaeon]MDW8127842.1 YfcE family phosphodiesterase [Archaeoglobaceae archaeon]